MCLQLTANTPSTSKPHALANLPSHAHVLHQIFFHCPFVTSEQVAFSPADVPFLAPCFTLPNLPEFKLQPAASHASSCFSFLLRKLHFRTSCSCQGLLSPLLPALVETCPCHDGSIIFPHQLLAIKAKQKDDDGAGFFGLQKKMRRSWPGDMYEK